MPTPVSDIVPLLLASNDDDGSLTDEFISGLVQGGAWRFGGGPHVLTYSLDANFDGATQPWLPPWIGAVANAFQAWANVANIGFRMVGVPDAVAQNSSKADISISLDPADGQGVLVGLGLFPDPQSADQLLEAFGYSRAGGPFPYPRPEGDISFESLNPVFAGGLAPGTRGFYAILHEIGHTLGLKHTGDDGGNGRPTFEALSLGQYDIARYTIMQGEIPATGNVPQGPSLLDILAIQHIYGANLAYHRGNDTYSVGNHLGAIWDAGGIDTLSGRYAHGGLHIDLREGSFSGGQHLSGQLAIAYDTTIENAIGGAGNDRIIGNFAANRIDGGRGADTMQGGRGNDSYFVDRAQDHVEEHSDSGVDIVRSTVTLTLDDHVEKLVLLGDAGISGGGNDISNYLKGNVGRNRLEGEGGADTLDGGGGKDTLVGGAGSDVYLLDSSRDVIVELSPPGLVEITPNASYHPIDISADGRYVLLGTSEIGVVPGDEDSGIDFVVLDRNTGKLVPVSSGLEGGFTANDGLIGTISGDGRHLVFVGSQNLAGDPDPPSGIFMRDLASGATTLLADGYQYSLSDGGRYLAFTTTSSDVVAGDTNGFADVFLKDLQTGLVALVSGGLDGIPASGIEGKVSADGRFVVFRSSADLVGDGLSSGVYLKNMETGVVTLVSATSGGEAANGDSFSGYLSADGRYVVFASDATNLVPGDTNGITDVFLRDMQEGTVRRVSTSSSGAQAVGPTDMGIHQQDPVISADGRFVLFSSLSTNLVAHDTNDSMDVFVKNLETGAIARVSLTEDGRQIAGSSHRIGFSDDGRYILFNGSDERPEHFHTGGYVTANPFLGGAASFDPGGTDTVRSSVTCVLPDAIERLVMTGGAAIKGTGNALDNTMDGNDAGNTLAGAGGDDILDGKGGADRLLGGTGNDRLFWDPLDTLVDGGAGTDTLKIAAGNLDLTSVADARIVNVEQIDLSVTGANTLTLTETDVLAISPTHPLKILGGGNDAVDIAGSFTPGAEAGGYVTYTVGAATLLIEDAVTVS